MAVGTRNWLPARVVQAVVKLVFSRLKKSKRASSA